MIEDLFADFCWQKDLLLFFCKRFIIESDKEVRAMKERTYAILNRLINSEIPLSVKYLSSEFEVSERTIRNEIGTINELLIEYQLPLVESIRSRGMHLTLTNSQIRKIRELEKSKSEFKYLTREERVLDLILGIAFGKEPIFLNRKEEMYQVSKSSIAEDIRQVRRNLEYYHVKVVSIPKQGLQFQAKEQFIRAMLFSIISTILLSDDQGKKGIVFKYLNKGQFSYLDEIYSKFISNLEVSHYRTNFNLLVYIWIARIQQGKYISESEEDEGLVQQNNKVYRYINAVLNKVGVKINLEEESYIYFLLNTLNREDDYRPINWLDLQLLIMQFIQYVETETGIPFSKKEAQLQEALYNHMISMVERIKNGLQLVNPLRDKIKQTYGVVYKVVESYLKTNESEFGGSITEDEIAFLTIHFSTALSEINQNNKYWYRAIVICNHGIATGRLLAENLKEYFNIEVLAVLSSREINLVKKFDVDLVFSTVKMSYNSKPIMILDTIFNDETKILVKHFLESNSQYRRLITTRNDYTEMFQKLLKMVEQTFGEISNNFYGDLEKLFHKNQLEINKREVQPMIQDILSDDNILLETEEFTWQEAIKKVAEPLLSKEIITGDYIQAMIESVEEYGPYIVIGPHLALAHARPEDGSLKLGLSLSIFEKPVVFGHEFNDPVKVMFCLSAIDSYSHLNVMKRLVNLIREEDNLIKLTEAKSIKTVKEILFNEAIEEEK
ncbi:BglG family transcription antiterminator [Streptococcus pasteurianus]|uniref:BglG family transcription antiterminator n=4 Tax=Streptococcus TaxID=1301 RepID=UPI0007977880|nr:BglG family transcription antiterminator [Streptococcus pasteurianus]KXI12858.1 phosphoenolpyruvate-dependent sugar phosphotransferase system, EIIA 2 [Streptococcus pasteurianus]MDU6639316.1 BglG family transcription antiterminator [Streptococcus sp.]MDU7846618.1 BglG family transcription antiterminator [Streptococcus sp.]